MECWPRASMATVMWDSSNIWFTALLTVTVADWMQLGYGQLCTSSFFTIELVDGIHALMSSGTLSSFIPLPRSQGECSFRINSEGTGRNQRTTTCSCVLASATSRSRILLRLHHNFIQEETFTLGLYILSRFSTRDQIWFTRLSEWPW